MHESLLLTASCLLLMALSLHILFREKQSGGALSFAVFVFCLAEAGNWILLNGYGSFERPVLFAESLLPLATLLLGFGYGRRWASTRPAAWQKALAALSLFFPAAVALLPAPAFFPSPFPAWPGKVLPLGMAGYLFYLGIMLFCILALFNLEATFKAIPAPEKWKMKFQVIGYGSVLAVFIFYYSKGLLYHSIDLGLAPARSGVIIISTLLILYARVFRGSGVKVVVSRYVLYRSLTVVLVGGYLIGLGLIGVEIKYLGISLGMGLEVFSAFAAAIFTVILLLSSRFRREIKVFVSRNFFASKHDYRAVWLSFTGQLAHCRTTEEVEDAVLRTFINSFGLRGAALYLYNRDRKSCFFSAGHLLSPEIKQVRVSPALASYFLKGNILGAKDGEYAPTDEEAAFFRQADPHRKETRGREEFLAVPLTINMELEGFVLMGRQLTSEKLTHEDFDLMKNLANQASFALRIFRLSEELAQTREAAAINRMSSFVVHDLKNLATSLSLLIENSEHYLSDPDFQQDMVRTVQNTVSKMLGLISRLKPAPEKQVLNPEPADLNELALETVAEISKSNRKAVITCRGIRAVSMVDKEEIRKVMVNLLFNALEASGQNGSISVATGGAEDFVFIRTEDDGCGMSEEFLRNGLFRPFKTTKKKGLGIGLCQCKQIVESHGGRIEVESGKDKGSVFTIYLPALKEGE